MKYLWLVLAFLIVVVGVLAGRLLGLSLATTVTIAAVPAFLASFPFVKQRIPKVSFGLWLLAAVISTAVAWLLYFAFS